MSDIDQNIEYRLRTLEENQREMKEMLVKIGVKVDSLCSDKEEREDDHDEIVRLGTKMSLIERLLYGSLGVGGTAVAGHVVNWVNN